MRAVPPRDLTEEEKARPYSYLYYRELLGPADLQKAAAAKGGFDPKYGVTSDNLIDRITNIPEEAEAGYCYMPGGGAFVCGKTEMPGITVDMYRHWLYWWNGEAPDEADMRYKCWCPSAHQNSGFMWSAENIGDYVCDFFITEPLCDHPEKLGLTEQDLKNAHILMMDGANARQKYINEDLMQKPIPSVVIHWLYEGEGGIIMRSFFWIGYQAMGGKLINVSGDKKLVEEDFLQALLLHNSEEMRGLAQIMPILYDKFRDK